MPHDLLGARRQPHSWQMPVNPPWGLPRQALAYATHRGHPRLRARRELRFDLCAHRVADGGAHGRRGGVRALGEELHAAVVAGVERMVVAEDILWVVLSVEALPAACKGLAGTV